MICLKNSTHRLHCIPKPGCWQHNDYFPWYNCSCHFANLFSKTGPVQIIFQSKINVQTLWAKKAETSKSVYVTKSWLWQKVPTRPEMISLTTILQYRSQFFHILNYLVLQETWEHSSTYHHEYSLNQFSINLHAEFRNQLVSQSN